MRWPQPSAPDHPEYGARALLTTSAGTFVLTVWTHLASSLERIEDDRWASTSWGGGGFGGLDGLAAELERYGVPPAEAAALAPQVAAEWRERWRRRESEIRWPSFTLMAYGVAAGVVVPALAGAGVVLARARRAND